MLIVPLLKLSESSSATLNHRPDLTLVILPSMSDLTWLYNKLDKYISSTDGPTSTPFPLSNTVWAELVPELRRLETTEESEKVQYHALIGDSQLAQLTWLLLLKKKKADDKVTDKMIKGRLLFGSLPQRSVAKPLSLSHLAGAWRYQYQRCFHCHYEALDCRRPS